MTSKEALEVLNNPLKKEHWDLQNEAYNLLTDLVEKDTPKKVIKEVKDLIDRHGYYERNIYRCGGCKKVIIIDRHQKLQDNEKTNYCYYCGQKLLW